MTVSYFRILTWIYALSLALFASLLSTGCANSTKKGTSVNLENSLVNDLADGQLDMPLDRACLIASGVTREKALQKYLEKIRMLVSRIKQETGINNTINPSEKASILFNWLQENENNGVYKDCYDFKDTLNLKVGNCLSYAVRFTILCRQFGINNIKNVLVPGHIYNIINDHGKILYFEHTYTDGRVKETDIHNPQRKIMKDRELIAEIYLYRARNANSEKKYEQSLKYCQLALLGSPDDKRPIILIVDNYVAKKDFNHAFYYLENYLNNNPDDKQSLENTYIILRRLCRNSNTTIAP